jgi:threonine synthase
VLARAAGRELRVFVPPSAHPGVLARLHALDARVEICPRPPGTTGDPCYHRFRSAVVQGAVPFCCQGPDNGMTIEGAAPIAWEILDAMGPDMPDRVFVQVGGGALASALGLAFADARALGRSARLPRLHAVQTAGGFPLARAWDRVVAHLLNGDSLAASADHPQAPETAEVAPEPAAVRPPRGLSPAADLDPSLRVPLETALAGATIPDLADALASGSSAVVRDALARHVLRRLPSTAIDQALDFAGTHRSAFMTPWPTEPQSLATGILDDETYDWLAVVEAMLRSGGYPIVVDEPTVAAAHQLAHAHTTIDVCPTGTAGLAGLLALHASGIALDNERLVVLFTGATRH